MSSQLDSPVLLLDKNYQPIRIATAKIAVMLLFAEKALVLDSTYATYSLEEWVEYSRQSDATDLPVLRSATVNIIVPEVIVVPSYLRKPEHGKKLKYSRMSIFRRDNFKCQYCGDEKKRPDLTVDHIIPKSRGGRSSWTNIATACKKCNWKKADRTPIEAGMKLLSVPRIPTWKEPLHLPSGIKKDLWTNFLSDS
jgi:5-methylcytosine-specific restriction endonuclease McrA